MAVKHFSAVTDGRMERCMAWRRNHQPLLKLLSTEKVASHPFVATARFEDYNAKQNLWLARCLRVMIGKCSECISLYA
jgi:hypothetical protein